MTALIPITVVDNFFETPSLIRKLALNLEYSKANGVYPGVRTQFIHQIDPAFARFFNQKVFSLFYDFDVHRVNLKVEGMFQLISEEYEEGWVHNDLNPASTIPETDWDIAGVVYLTPNAPLNSGTSIYKINHDKMVSREQVEINGHWKRRFYHKDLLESELDEYRKRRDEYNNSFYETITVNNIYNRLVLYNAAEYHRGNKFFGSTLDDSRLTLVFFAKVQPVNWVKNPIERTKSVNY
jgi:hypothetical protein